MGHGRRPRDEQGDARIDLPRKLAGQVILLGLQLRRSKDVLPIPGCVGIGVGAGDRVESEIRR
jgi:hypothetical protein